MKKSNWLLFFAMLLVSCLEDPECFNLSNNIIGFTYRVIGSGSTDVLSFTGITVETNDSVVFNENFSGSTFTMPLDLFHEQMKLTFQGLDDSLQLGYTVQSQFVSEDCGPRFVLSGLNVLGHSFDSVRVIQPIPRSNNTAKNIEIYRCPVIENTTFQFFQLYTITRESTPLKFSFTGISPDFAPDVYYAGKSVSSVTLPLNLQAPVTKFTFTSGATSEELALTYRLTSEARYRPCGLQTFIDSMRISSATFDSVSISRDADRRLQDVVTDPAQTNVKIYKCPETNLVQVAFKKPADDGSANTVANPVTLTGIRTNYSDKILYAGAKSLSTVILPLNPSSDTTQFNIEYADGSAETIELVYVRQGQTIFRACGEQTTFSQLKEAIDLPNVAILETDSVTFPPVTNLEIFP